MARRARRERTADDTVGKRVRLDRRVWTALEMLARDRDNTAVELFEEAIADVLAEHGRSADLRESLELSARASRRGDRGGGRRGRAQSSRTTRPSAPGKAG